MAGCRRHVLSRKRPRSGGMVACGGSPGAPARRWARALRSAPGGWLPLRGWSSCWGSPRSTSERPAGETATVLARLNWPASSTRSTSTLPAIAGADQSQAVPPTTWSVPAARAAAMSRASPERLGIGACGLLVAGGLLADDDARPGCRPGARLLRRRHHGVEDVADHLVAVGGHAHGLARGDEGEDHPRPGVRLAGAGRALDGEGAAVEGEGDAHGGVEGALVGGSGAGHRVRRAFRRRSAAGVEGGARARHGTRRRRRGPRRRQPRQRPRTPAIPCSATHRPIRRRESSMTVVRTKSFGMSDAGVPRSSCFFVR